MKGVLINSYDFEKLGAVISHFKFIAGMNVGEKRRSQLGVLWLSAWWQGFASLIDGRRDYRGHESLVIPFWWKVRVALLAWRRALGNAAFIFCRPCRKWENYLNAWIAKSLFKGQQVSLSGDPVEIKQEEMLQLQLNEAIGLNLWKLDKTAPPPVFLIIGGIRNGETARAVVKKTGFGWVLHSIFDNPRQEYSRIYERLLN